MKGTLLLLVCLSQVEVVEKQGWQGWPADAPAAAVAPFDAMQATRHQQAWAEYLKVPVEQEVVLGKNAEGEEVRLTLVLIPPGEYLMGSTDEEQTEFLRRARTARGSRRWDAPRIPKEGPQHRVRITQPFYLGKQEVTQAQWEVVTGENPSQYKDGPSHPVESVGWNDVEAFVKKVNGGMKSEELTLALPTEAQWEYACRAGTTTYWHSGDSEDDLQQVAWYQANAGRGTHAVGERKPNAWGLHDMHGNVWEWCADWLGDYTEDAVNDPAGPASGRLRVIRGGRWNRPAGPLRSAHRYYNLPNTRRLTIGFRVAATLPDGDSQE